MITPAKISSRYWLVERYLPHLRGLVRDPLLLLCERHGFAFSSRIKTVDSVAEKIEAGRLRSWVDIDDLVAFTIVVPTLTDEPGVLGYLENRFDRIALKPRGSARKAPDVFRFDCTRFIGRLRRHDGLASADPLYSVPFEVQVRSAFEHAWTVSTHSLAYKSDDLSWQRIRLAAQLRASVEQLDMLVRGFDAAAEQIPASEWPEMVAKTEIKTFFQDEIRNRRIPNELAPKDLSRFVDNVYELVHRCCRARGVDAARILMESFAESEAGDDLPLSLSLWQLVFARLSKAHHFRIPEGYWPLITPELEDLFPHVRGIVQRFDYT